MKLLLDTHTFIWWDSDPVRLSTVALGAIRDPANSVWLSVVSIWEMVIKADLGKLTLRLPIADIVAHQLANGLQLMNAEVSHVFAVEGLPKAHKDPFDRLLVGQASVEAAHLVTVDPVFKPYPVRLIW